MAKQYNMTHQMFVANSMEEAQLVRSFMEEFCYEYQYVDLGINIDNNNALGTVTEYPKGVVFAVLKNNNIREGKKFIFFVDKEQLDLGLFKGELSLFEKEQGLQITHTLHNVSIGVNKSSQPHNTRNRNNTSKSVGEKWVASR